MSKSHNHGGRRPGAGSGGARPGAGRPVNRIHLDKDAAQKLRILVLNRRSLGSEIDEHQFVANLIHEWYDDYEQSIEDAMEEMEEFSDGMD